MKLPTLAMHGPILGVPRTAGRDSGLSLARRAKERGPSTSASMSVTTSLRSRNFPFPSTSAGFSLPVLPYRASFISPPWKPPRPRNRHRPRPFGGQCIIPNARATASSILAASRRSGGRGRLRARGPREIAGDPLDFGLDNPIFRLLFRLVTSLRFGIPAAMADRQASASVGEMKKIVEESRGRVSFQT